MPVQFGSDVNLAYGDLTYDGRGRPQYTTGIDTLAQALYHRFVCPPGKLLLHPSYGGGFTSFLGQPMTQSLTSKIAAAAQAQALLDQRVQAVPSCTVVPLNNNSAMPGFVISLTATTAAGTSTLSIPIQSTP